MFITCYFIVIRLPDSLRSVRDHFLSLDPTVLTIDLLEQHLLAAKTSVVAVGATRGTPHTPFFEGCSPSPLSPSYASAAAVNVPRAEDVGAASASAKRRSNKGKGGRAGGGGSGSGGGGSSGGGGGNGGGGSGGSGGMSGGFGGGGGGSSGSGSSGSGGSGGGRTGAQRGASRGGQRQRQQRRSETPLPQQLREWLFQRGASGGSVSRPYVIRTGDRAGQTCGKPHTQHRCFYRLDDAWRAEFGDEVERPHWAELLRSRVAIFDLDYDAILSAMYALSASAKGDCYRCVPPDPGIEAAALCASESSLPGTAPAGALHTFTLDSGASRCFFHDSTTLTPLPAPVSARLANPSGGPVLARSSTVLPCPDVPSGSLSGLHLPSFSTNLVSTAALQDAMVTTTTPGGQGVSICTCTRTGRHLATFTRSTPLTLQTLLWHHRLGHPSLPRLRGMHSRLLVSGLPRSLPVLLPSSSPPFLPCVEGRQRAAPQSSSFPPMTAPLQTLHMDVWGPARVSGQGRKRNFLLVVDDYTRYTTVFPLRIKGEVPDVLIPWIRAVHLQLRKRFGQELPVLRLQSYIGGESGGAEPGGAKPGGVEPGGAESGGVEPRGVEPGGVEPGDTESEGAESTGAEPGGAEPGGAEPWAAASSRGPASTSLRLSPWPEPLSPQQLREWLVRRERLWSGAARAGAPTEPGAAGAGGAGAGCTGAGGAGGSGAGAGGTSVGGAGAGGARAVDLGAGGTRVEDADGTGAGDIVRPRLYFVPLLQQVLSVPSSSGLTPPLLCPLLDQSQPRLLSASPLPAPSPYTEQSGGHTERHEPASRPVLTVRTTRCIPHLRPPSVPGTHAMALRPSSVPLRVPLPAPPESSLPQVPDLEFDRARAASPTVSRLLATAVTDPSFESAFASALVAELLDFAAAYHLDYATALVAESESASPPSVGGECALGTDVLEDRQEYFECLAAAVPRFASMLLAPEGDPDAPDTPTLCAYAEAITGTYVDEVPPLGVNIVDGMWIFRVKRPPSSPPAFKTRYVARGLSLRHGVEYFQTFSPTPKMTTLRVLLYVAAQRDYELHAMDFRTDFLQGSLHEEIWLRRPPGFTWSFRAGTQWSLHRPVYGLRQAPREWHNTLRTTLAALGFTPSTADPSLFLRTNTLLPPFYILVYVNDLVFSTADAEALTLVKSDLQKRHTCTDLGELRSYLGLQITQDRARRTITLTQSHMVDHALQCFSFQFSSPQPTPLSTSHSLSAPPSNESVEPSGAMAAQELRWLTYLLIDLGEQPRSPPVLYVDNKAMIALCQEHRLEHRTKHIALRYFLARELQQRGQLRLVYGATRANVADIFSKALPPGDHQRFVTVLGLVPTLPHLLTA
ncbi:unnamed protein product [Closterium sp. NIES-54]